MNNIFNFDCSTCEYNRGCYGGNMGNQFQYCQKSSEKVRELINISERLKKLEQEILTFKKDKNNKNT